MSNKIIVWDLFGGLNGSVRKALEGQQEYEIYTIDILEQTKDGVKNINIDLTDEYQDLYLKLTVLPKPDIIVASPMCKSFSRASAMKGGSTGWILNPKTKTISLRDPEDFENKEINWMKGSEKRKPHWRFNFEKSIANALLGEAAIKNTMRIIDDFKPSKWYIENPANSLIWNYIKFNLIPKFHPVSKAGILNLAHYGAYGGASKKPTIFMSNIELKLKKVEKNYKSAKQCDYLKRSDRSDIPLLLLLQEIFKQFKEHENDN